MMPPCERLDWDSEFFGRRIARVRSLAGALEWAAAERIDCLYFLADPDPESIAAAEASGFRLVDIRVTLERPLGEAPERPTGIRPARPEDIPALRAIAARAHHGGRFDADPVFHARRAALYETWIENSCRGYADAVFVSSAENLAAGYVSCHLSPEKEGSIGLLAVDTPFRQRGLGARLVNAALEYFRENGMRRARVVTQGANSASQRLYQNCGFRTVATQLWYHRHFSC
jgi:dTDP-4-amino-4,6-dideoxy-D-galactose acyltransferase